ncbi:hypothetical protein C9374_006932 [Naegleria lovaniensis]|uniref:Uncharacterized protein n=1 Tax=Naegleria lovaniensis TaxID=51637 RepID=A0AA88H647_NAELO|nr:uncharacterized protein C9374_006932 [Naegleria lovaniensis]KAG2393401.1 hypothetical protein C9374_006932 [Naegleria lovaniensis]
MGVFSFALGIAIGGYWTKKMIMRQLGQEWTPVKSSLQRFGVWSSDDDDDSISIDPSLQSENKNIQQDVITKQRVHDMDDSDNQNLLSLSRDFITKLQSRQNFMLLEAQEKSTKPER